MPPGGSWMACGDAGFRGALPLHELGVQLANYFQLSFCLLLKCICAERLGVLNRVYGVP